MEAMPPGEDNNESLYTLVLSAGLAICAATTAVQAQALIEEWGTAKFPAPRR
jgi:hypothetical protein